MYNSGSPCEWYKYIEKCKGNNNKNIVKIKSTYCVLLVEIKTIYKMNGTYIKIKHNNYILVISTFIMVATSYGHSLPSTGQLIKT
jgi:hypothetical protein